MTAKAAGGIDRRGFLRRVGLVASAGTAATLLGSGWTAASASPRRGPTAPSLDPDQLFMDGHFGEADRGYARILRQDPGNAHAAAQIGYIAVLSNRFGRAERFLTEAARLAPDDTFSRQQLADCFVRQDQFARAASVLRQTGDQADAAAAEQYAAVADAGTPYQVRGAAVTRLPFLGIDPYPYVEASLNGGPPKPFYLDTGSASPGFDLAVADELGLRAVASTTAHLAGGHTFTMFYGVLDSFRLGDIELRNIPVSWSDVTRPAPAEGPVPVGSFGTTLFYHFLTTMDYAGQGLVLRRKSEAARRTFRDTARRAGASVLPLWLAATHFPCTLGSLNSYGPKVVSVDTGGKGIGVGTTEAIAAQAGIAVDHDHPTTFNGVEVYPIAPDEISLGHAVGRHVPGVAGSVFQSDRFHFHTIANFTHEFFKPFAITFDFVDMRFYVQPATRPPGTATR